MWKPSDKFDPDTLGDEERIRVGRRITLAIMVCAALGIAAAVSALCAKPSFRDTVGAPVQSAVGRITRVSYAKEGDDYGPNPAYVFSLQVDGKELDVRGAQISQELKKGQRVHFTYRKGKSGRWYLQSIQPQ